jgi:hypothetical protein
MDLLQIEKINLLVKSAIELQTFLEADDLAYVNSIIERNLLILKKYHLEKLVITNATKTEIGLLNSTIKKTVYGAYFNKLKKQNKKVFLEFQERCINLFLDEQFKSKYILYCRSCDKYRQSPLEKAIKDSLLNHIQIEFYNQNKDFINKLEFKP